MSCRFIVSMGLVFALAGATPPCLFTASAAAATNGPDTQDQAATEADGFDLAEASWSDAAWGDSNKGDAYLYFRVSRAEFRPLGESDWEISHWDFVLGLRGKRRIEGPFYFGAGLEFIFGFGEDDLSGDQADALVEENYARFGFGGDAELGVRIPLGSSMHVDTGLRLGGYWVSGGGSETDFRYSHAILWAGPAIALEPNRESGGVVALALVQFPLFGDFSMDHYTDAMPSPDFDVSGGFVLRFELGYKFSGGMGIVAFADLNKFRYDDIGRQDHSTFGVEFRLGSW